MGKSELNLDSNATPSHHNRPSVHSKKASDAASGDRRVSTLSVNNSMQELVAFDEEGHPFIDINKLAYKPRKKHHDHQREKLSWYAPDFSFIVFNFMSLGCSTYFILIGNTTLTWKASIGMFSLPSCYSVHGYNFTNGSRIPSTNRKKPDDFFFAPCDIFLHEPPFWDQATQLPSEGYNFSIPGSHPVFRTKLTDAHYFGLVLICISLLNVLNVCVGIQSCLQGYKNLLYGHIIVDGIIVLIEFVICAAVHFTGRCEDKDIEIIRVLLRHFIQWYGLVQKPVESESAREKLLTNEIDSLQIGLGCCGADGWQDYLVSSKNYPQSILPQTSDIDDTESVLPFSCCRPWWIRNIYCAHGAHRWGHPMASAAKAFQFHERINQESCVFKIEKMCFKIKSLMGGQGFITTFFHMIFIIMEALAIFILVRNINTLIKEKKRIMRQKEISREGDDSGDEFEAMDSESTSHFRVPVDDTMMSGRVSGDSLITRGTGTASFRKSRGIFTKIPPPTEDEIVMIKQRSNFNQFITKVKTSHVGRWMKEAREKVTDGHEDDDSNQQKLTAAEKKMREKELLHKVKSKGDDDSDEGKSHHHHHHHHGHEKHMSVAVLERLANVGEEQKEEMRKRRSSSRNRKGKHVTMNNKVKSKLSMGHIFKRKSHPKGGDDFEQKMAAVKSSDEEEHHKSLSAMASKYGKKKSKKRRRFVPVPALSLVLVASKKAWKSHLKRKLPGKTESSTEMLSKEEGEQEEEEVEKEIEAEVEKDKKLPEKTSSKQKVNVTRSQTEPSNPSSGWESETSETGEEGGSEGEKDSDEHRRRKRKKRKKSRRKKIKAARKRREKHKDKRPRPWFAYF